MIKHLSTIIFLFVSFMTLAQEKKKAYKNTIIPKNTSIIYVKGVAFDSIVSELKREDYKLVNVVRNVSISTGDKSTSAFNRTIALHIRFYDSTAEIMGTIYKSTGGFSSKPREVMTYTSALKKYFEFMNNFALSLHGEIRYEK